MDIQSVSLLQVERTRAMSRADNARETESASAKAPVYDEYLPGEGPVREASGLYQITHDEDGTPRIRFDAPQEDEDASDSPKPSAPEDRAETTTCDTDKVDREIENLRKIVERLERQLQVVTDGERAEKLEKQLEQAKQELQQKDNDTYRRQHAEFF